MGNQKNGGIARAKALTPRRRAKIAKKAALARWAGHKIPEFFRPVQYIGETARQAMRREDDSPTKNLKVPLIDHRQMYYLRILAAQGIMGQTPSEVAAWFIMEGIKTCMDEEQVGMARLNPPENWEGFKA